MEDKKDLKSILKRVSDEKLYTLYRSLVTEMKRRHREELKSYNGGRKTNESKKEG